MTQASENNVISEDVSKLESATDNVDHSQSGHDNNVEEDLGENKDENKTGKNSQAEEGTDESLASPPPKNTRMKGYFVIAIVSFVNYAAADVKKDGEFNTPININEDESGLTIVMVSSIISMVLCSFMVIIGLDRFTRLQRYWKQVIQPKSKIELVILVFLVIWWTVFTFIITAVTGVAGGGSRLYNVYFSTWICLITSFWTLERWVVRAGYMTSLYDFMMESPNRSAGWMVLGIASILNLLFHVNTKNNWDSAVINLEDEDKQKNVKDYFDNIYSNGQPEWVIALTIITAIVSVVFILIEIFRNNRSAQQSEQPEIEIKMEGIMLFVLTICWVPTGFFVTTIGGVANAISNIYFFTWLCTILVVYSFVSWVRYWREMVWRVIEKQDAEYNKAKQRTIQVDEQAGAEEKLEEEEKVEVKPEIRHSLW
eukprot:CAMPEP_0172485676 /NCGR_PEP_ID=MMETSP1066-20121228/13799_1 /TAXON_ID=671091 /ORGANISM="Coscinodiscus wailesii, Strain CCMP2513" /LENGTH=426 /DNA_ID=CAMNT_0013251075 /DNA_START=280 /DNA_END=1557 /DNA_ORIENTATION=+